LPNDPTSVARVTSISNLRTVVPMTVIAGGRSERSQLAAEKALSSWWHDPTRGARLVYLP